MPEASSAALANLAPRTAGGIGGDGEVGEAFYGEVSVCKTDGPSTCMNPAAFKPVTISGALGDDAKPYQLQAVRSAIEESKT